MNTGSAALTLSYMATGHGQALAHSLLEVCLPVCVVKPIFLNSDDAFQGDFVSSQPFLTPGIIVKCKDEQFLANSKELIEVSNVD